MPWPLPFVVKNGSNLVNLIRRLTRISDRNGHVRGLDRRVSPDGGHVSAGHTVIVIWPSPSIASRALTTMLISAVSDGLDRR